jgi:hypothetical protein
MTMHPGFDPAEIAEAMEDAEATASEYGALFRSDVSRLFAREVLAASVDQGVAERPYDPRHEYVGFCDPSGGNGRDGFTLGIAHVSHGSNVAELDVCREIAPPFNPQETIREFCDLLTQ